MPEGRGSNSAEVGLIITLDEFLHRTLYQIVTIKDLEGFAMGAQKMKQTLPEDGLVTFMEAADELRALKQEFLIVHAKTLKWGSYRVFFRHLKECFKLSLRASALKQKAKAADKYLKELQRSETPLQPQFRPWKGYRRNLSRKVLEVQGGLKTASDRLRNALEGIAEAQFAEDQAGRVQFVQKARVALMGIRVKLSE